MGTRRIPPLAAFLFVAATVSAAAQPDVDQSRRNAIVRAIEKAAPAVVSINVVQVEAERLVHPFARDFWDFFDFSPPRYRLRERQVDSVGSGFIFDGKGHILTNYHVIEGAKSIASVTLADGRELEVTLVGSDDRTDLALLRANGTDLPHVDLGDSDGLLIGEWVVAIGNPFGPVMKDPQPTVSVGVVSANHRRLSPTIGGGERLYQGMIQTDAAINPGNSGGPLVNAKGEAVGVNTMILSRSGGNIGLGFAIPVNRARRVAEELMGHGRRRDPWPGFRIDDVQSIPAIIRQEHGIVQGSGCLVVKILEDSPAYEAGLRPGDVIIAVNGQPMTSSSDIDFAIWDLFVGDTMVLEIDRQGRRETLRFTLKELAQ